MSGLRVILGLRPKEFYWDPLKGVNPHCMIVGTPGAGKTQLLKTIAAELARQDVPVLVFDIHGEYRGLVEDLGGRYLNFYGEVRINPLDPGGMSPRAVAWEIREIIANIFKGLGDVQLNLLYELILDAYKEKGFNIDKEPEEKLEPPDFNDLARILEARRAEKPRDRSLEGLLARLKPLLDFGLFAAEYGLNVSELLKPGITVIDLSTLPVPSDELKAATVVFTSRKLWNHLYLLGEAEAPKLRLALVLDEAHRYVFRDSPINRMLREGRKFGVSVLLASQMLGDMPEEAIANVNLKIALRLDEPRDRKRIVEIFRKKVKVEELPEERFEALVYLDGRVERITVLPYYEYRKLAPGRAEEAVRETTTPSLPSIPSGEPTTLEELVEAAVRGNNIPLLDALHQWAQNPTSATAGYGVEENYSFILENLRTRYGDETAEEAVEILRTRMSRIMDVEHDVYKLRDELMKLLRETGGLEMLKREALRRVSKLSPSEKLALYLALGTLSGPEDYRFDRLSTVQKILMGLGLHFDPEELERMALWAGATSKLLWISSKRDKRGSVFTEPDFIDEIYEELEKSSKVALLRDEFAEAVGEAIEVWHVDALRALLELEERGYFFTQKPLQLAGPEKYAKILARHVRCEPGTTPTYCYIIPRRFREVISRALKPLKRHIERVEELVGNYVVDYIKTRAPHAERGPSPLGNCARINVREPGGGVASFDVCVRRSLEAEITPAEQDTISVSVLAHLDACSPGKLAGKRVGLIVAKPKAVVSCAGTLRNAAMEFFEGLREYLEANL